ncbi:hypothetical protein SAMN05421748_106305 [Paractinoplanes atraurantiacus]|uniref:Uncharacterized protein n=2 Tax=Paractinoplanes atraurantiacus TaxID=1036182 RepID=A0A285I659_9ACTN|nr:hypothetical protein SAMN05421748_106305 [Actinoplanes atraurantiacus]
MTSLSSLASAAFNSARSTLKDMAEAAAAQSQTTISNRAKPSAASDRATSDRAATDRAASGDAAKSTVAAAAEKPALGAIEQAVADRKAAGTEPKPFKVRQGLALDSYA